MNVNAGAESFGPIVGLLNLIIIFSSNMPTVAMPANTSQYCAAHGVLA
jgi:hypothetical protein